MKKILAIVMSVAMILSLFTVVAAAESAPGKFQTGEDTFEPVGDMKIAWDDQVSTKLNVTDGNMQDWADAGYTLYNITPENMVSWVDNANSAEGAAPTDTSMPENWQLQAYFVADSDYLYIGFYVMDDDVVVRDASQTYINGDAFQFAIDFDNILGKAIEEEGLDATTSQCVFYSFGPTSTEPTPITITIQNTDGDRNGDFISGTDTGIPTADGETIYDEKADILGATSVTDNGWQAEFALSWNQFYGDLTYKTYNEEIEFYVGEDDNLDLSCALYYQNHDTVLTEDGAVDAAATAGINWAAGTLKGQEAGVQPEVTWTPFDNGMMMYLEWFQGMVINCDGITVLNEGETIPPVVEETEAEETEAPAVEDTVADEGTAAGEGTAAEAGTSAEAGTTAGTTAASTDEGGCASVVGFGAAAVLMAAAAAAVVLKKKD